jgi:hypothetical protein
MVLENMRLDVSMIQTAFFAMCRTTTAFENVDATGMGTATPQSLFKQRLFA